MKTIIINLIILFSIISIAFSSCTTDPEAENLQKPYEYSEAYYENLRAYKATMHERPLSFVWFADYSSSHSMGIRFMGLPDSLDICSLWGGIPSDIEGKPNTFYSPETHKEMRFVQNVKGTKMVHVEFSLIGGNYEYINEIPLVNGNERIIAFADTLLAIVEQNDLDGLDLDYEPGFDVGSKWIYGQQFIEFLEYLGKYIGPKSPNPEKLLLVDGHVPDGGYEYMSYFVVQAYHSSGARDLQNRFNKAAAKGCTPDKYVVTENMGDYYATGGTPFTEADGNTESALGGRMHSLEGMARWNPTQGAKGGFGSFFAHRDYNSNPPYKYLRLGIQLQNPSK